MIFPNMRNVLVLTFICGLAALSTGLRCLRCNEVYNPILCNYITTCGYGEICGIEKVRNENGELRYNLGCKSSKTCQDFKNLTDKGDLTRSSHRTSTYTTLCHDCCDKDICNLAGCGETGYPMDTGPVCMNCENIENPRSCDTIKACEQDELCYIQEKILFHMKIYTSKCVQRYVCDSSNGNIFGRKKRDFGSKVKRSFNFCTKCCSSKLCNDYCGNDSFPTTSASISTSTSTITTTVSSVSSTTGIIPFTINFTTCGQTGPNGPSLSACQSAYNTDWSRNRTLFNVIKGVQEWLVQQTAYYIIEAYGAAGGNGNLNVNFTEGGKGAKIEGTFYLTAGTMVRIVVGQRGEDGGNSEPGGGGGGSFVYAGFVGGSGLLIAAGGGGGNGEENTHPGYGGSSGAQAQYGYGFVGSSISSNGGIGYGGLGGNITTAGAGWKSDGGRHLGTDAGNPGKRWQGGIISQSNWKPGLGGFGGGGSAVYSNGGGGGGGYTGGSGISSSNRTMWGGSGAGSFNSGTNQKKISGSNHGDGLVIISTM